MLAQTKQLVAGPSWKSSSYYLLRKKEYKMYVLRDDTRSAVSTPTDLRKELYKQFGAGLISCALGFLWGISRGIQRSLFV